MLAKVHVELLVEHFSLDEIYAFLAAVDEVRAIGEEGRVESLAPATLLSNLGTVRAAPRDTWRVTVADDAPPTVLTGPPSACLAELGLEAA